MLLIKELISQQRMCGIRLMPMELTGFITYPHNSEKAAKRTIWWLIYGTIWETPLRAGVFVFQDVAYALITDCYTWRCPPHSQNPWGWKSRGGGESGSSHYSHLITDLHDFGLHPGNSKLCWFGPSSQEQENPLTRGHSVSIEWEETATWPSWHLMALNQQAKEGVVTVLVKMIDPDDQVET